MKRIYLSKSLLIIILLILIPVLSRAQIITTDPDVPVDTKSVKVYFHSDKVTGALKNYTGDIYTHTGVILKGVDGWQHVIGTWGNNSTQPHLSYLGNYTYELDITPDIRTFYNVNATDSIMKMAFVFRSADATKQTNDLFVDVFPEGLNISILIPETSQLILKPGDTLHMKATSTKADSMSLYFDKTYVTVTTTNEIDTNLIVTQTGSHMAYFIAYDSTGSVTDSFYFYVRPPVTTATLPDGIIDGINYINDTSVVLCLFAPYKKYAFAIGDFNNWLPSDSSYMKRTPDGNRYWIRINHLLPLQEYAFQYLVDGTIRIGDPYADKILDPWNDQWIPIWVYPGLKPYPKGKTEGIVSVLQTAQPPYPWKHNDFQPPKTEDLVVYELLIRDFTAKHTYRSLADTLGYLKRLGINAIELMPINEFEGNDSWGYNPDYYFAPDKYYGPKNDLKAFVDTCHAMGIAVIQDIVLNHSMGQCPLVMLYFDPEAGQWGEPSPENPWYNTTSPNPAYNWGYDFNHESPATKKFVTRVTRYWINEYHMDGYRFDFTKGFTNTPGDGWKYDSSRIQILEGYADSIREVKNNAILILEHFTENSEEKELADYGLLLWGNLNCQYGQATMGYPSGPCGGWDFSWISWKNRGWDNPNVVGYMESHDEERLMYKNLTYGNASGSYNIRDLSTALQRIELASAFFFTVPGPKMIWQFEELGYDYSIEYNGRTGDKPVRWDYYNDLRRRKLYQIMGSLISLKKHQPAFESSDFSLNTSSAVKTISIRDTSMDVLVVGNFDVTEQTTSVTFPAPGTWYEYFTGDSLILSSSDHSLTLEPGAYQLFTTKKLTPPDIPATVSNLRQARKNFKVFPNPANSNIYLTFSLRSAQALRIKLIGTNGTVYYTDTFRATSGKNEYTIPVRRKGSESLSAGLYLLLLQTRDSSWSEKIMIF